MNWKDIADLVGKAAPLVGTVLGGPAGGAIGSMIASVLGVDNNPDSIGEALKNDPQAFVLLKKFEMEHKERLEGMNLSLAETQIIQVNATMRAETASADPWSRRWRPMWGFISAFAFLATVIMVLGLMGLALWFGEVSIFQIIPTVINSMTGLFSIPMVILGVSAHHRGKMQRIQAGENQVNKSTLTAVSEKVRGVFRKKPKFD